MNKTDVYTYISESHNSTSWLDHCICSAMAHSSVKQYDVLTEHAVSDHIPLSVSLDCEVLLRYETCKLVICL